jgi:hypothetical protein
VTLSRFLLDDHRRGRALQRHGLHLGGSCFGRLGFLEFAIAALLTLGHDDLSVARGTLARRTKTKCRTAKNEINIVNIYYFDAIGIYMSILFSISSLLPILQIKADKG